MFSTTNDINNIGYMKTGSSSDVSPEHLMHLIEEERRQASMGKRFLYSFSDSIEEVDYYLSLALGHIIELPVKAVRAVGRGFTTFRIRSSGQPDTLEQLEQVRSMWQENDEDSDVQTFNIGNVAYHILRGLSIGIAINAAAFGGYGLYKAGDILIMSSDGEKTLEGFGATMRLLGAISAVAGGFEIALAYTSLGHLIVKFVVKTVKQVYNKVSTSYRNQRQARLLRKEEQAVARAARQETVASKPNVNVKPNGKPNVKPNVRDVTTTATVKSAAPTATVNPATVNPATARSRRRIRTQRQNQGQG